VRQVEAVAAVDAARRDQPDGGLVRLHVADLHARRVRAEQGRGPPSAAVGRGHRRRQVERVLHVARGVLRGHVERLEVVVIVLELGPLHDEKAHAGEDGLEPLPEERQRMAMPEERRASGQRDVDRVAGGARGRRGREPFGQRRVDLLFELIRRLTHGGSLLNR
jgi:hypothetical protein